MWANGPHYFQAQPLTSGAVSSRGSHDIRFSPFSVCSLCWSALSSACSIKVTYFSSGSLPIFSTAYRLSLRVLIGSAAPLFLDGWDLGGEGEEDAYFH